MSFVTVWLLGGMVMLNASIARCCLALVFVAMDHVVRAADALAAAYLEVIELPADTLGVIFAVFDQGDYPYDFVQPAVAIPRAKLAWCAEHGRQGDLWMPKDPPGFSGARPA